jgi:hypothetical protein
MSFPTSYSGDTKIKSDLIEKYISMVFEYLSIMQSSDVVRTMDTRTYSVQLGLSAITHIFKLAFINTKNISTTESYCQKGIYCYIEYLEQFNKLSMAPSQHIDFADAIGFIYDKTLSDLHTNGSSSVFTNILSVSQNHQAQGNDFAECMSILDQVASVSSSLLWHGTMSLTDQIDIVENHFVDFICGALMPGTLEPVFVFLDTIQTHMSGLTAKEYNDILSSTKKRLNGRVKLHESRTMDEIKQHVVDACLCLVANYSGKPLKYVVEQEGWKRPTDDLIKTIWG